MRIVALIVIAGIGWTGNLVADTTGDIEHAIRQLGDAKFASRQAGSRQLVKLAEADQPAVLRECLREYARTDDPEVKHRLRGVLEKVVDRYLYRAPRGFLGIQINQVIVNAGGQLIINGVSIPPGAVWISGVIADTAAAKIGLAANDVILAVDDQRWTENAQHEFIKYIQSKRPGEQVRLRVLHERKTNDLDVVLGDLPEEQRNRVLTEEGSREYFKTWLRKQMAADKPAAAQPAFDKRGTGR